MTKLSYPSTLLLVGSFTLLTTVATNVRAQSFTNGSFEAGPTRGSVGASSTAVSGWTTTIGGGGSAGIYNGNNSTNAWVPNAQSGTYCLQLDGSSATNDTAFANETTHTSVAQTFKLAVGSYTLSWYMSGEVGSGKTGTVGVLVSLSGVATGALTSAEYTVNNSVNQAAGNWTQQTAAFTVTNADAPITLTFADDNKTTLANYTASSNVALDNITVPEPATVFGGAALALVGGWHLRRRQRVSVA